MNADAYLVEVTTPSGDYRRELYHSLSGAEQAVAMYERQESVAISKQKWHAHIVPLSRLREAGDTQVQL